MIRIIAGVILGTAGAVLLVVAFACALLAETVRDIAPQIVLRRRAATHLERNRLKPVQSYSGVDAEETGHARASLTSALT